MSLGHLRHQIIDSKSVVDVCSDRAEEGSCLVSGARGSPIEGDPSVWTCLTNNYLMVDRLTTGEPQAVCRPEPGWPNPVGDHAHERR